MPDPINPHQLTMKPQFAVAYRGQMFEIVTWEGKPGVKFEAAARAPGVRLLIEIQKDGGKALLMTRELRREAGGHDYRLPGGKVFDSLAELDAHRATGTDIQPLAWQAAQKECREEAGISAGEYTLLGIATAGASVEWDLYYYRVSNAIRGAQQLEEHEQGDIETIVLSTKEIFTKLTNREIKEGRSADMLWHWLQANGFIEFVGGLS